MEILLVLVTSIALGVDSLVMLFVLAKSGRFYSLPEILRISVVIGFFHFMMPLVGGLLSFATIRVVENFSSYISAAVFILLGLKMIKDSAEEIKVPLVSSLWAILVLSYLVSVDALATGFSLSLANIDISIYLLSLIFALAAFIMSLLGYYIGRCSTFINPKLGFIIGGVVLILLGLKSLI